MICPLPCYWMCHILIALVIAACLWPLLGLYAGLCAGAFFYIGREFTQWEAGIPFDLKGLAAPVLACFITGLTYHGLSAWFHIL